MILLVLEANGIATEDRTTLGGTPVVRKAITVGRDRHLPRVYRQRRLLLQQGRRPAVEGPEPGLRGRQAARLRGQQDRLADAGAGQQHLGDRDPQGGGGRGQAQDHVRFRPLGRRRRQGGARRLGRVRELGGGPAGVPEDLWLHAQARAADRAVRRRHGGHDQGRGRPDQRRQRGHGLRHRRRHRGLGAGRAGGRPERPAGLRAGPDRPRGRAEARTRRSPRR